jgi:hypothetical protein
MAMGFLLSRLVRDAGSYRRAARRRRLPLMLSTTIVVVNNNLPLGAPKRYNGSDDWQRASIPNDEIASRREAAARYSEFGLGELCELPDDDPGHVYHQYVVRVPDRDLVREALTSEGVGSGIHYPIPVHLQEAYGFLGLGRGSYPHAETLADEILSLPMYPELSDEQARTVIGAVREFFL